MISYCGSPCLTRDISWAFVENTCTFFPIRTALSFTDETNVPSLVLLVLVDVIAFTLLAVLMIGDFSLAPAETVVTVMTWDAGLVVETVLAWDLGGSGGGGRHWVLRMVLSAECTN